MYFAKENESTKFFTYLFLIENFLNEKKIDDDLKTLLDEIIISTHNLVIEAIKQDEIDNKIYDIVVSLADFQKSKTREFFEQIDIDEISNEDYETLGIILNSILSDPSFIKNEY